LPDLPLQVLCGLTEDHLAPFDKDQLAHPAAASAFKAMAREARRQGHNLQAASAFRSFQRQAWIWDRKLRGDSPLKDVNGMPLPPDAPLSERLNATLRWSAIPGCSRHHWGCDFDIFDPDKLTEDRLQLEPWEYQDDGPFAALRDWLQRHAANFDFFFPYDRDRGGVAPEPWHISFGPVATDMLDSLTADKVATALQQHNILARADLIARLDQLLDKYVFNVQPWIRKGNRKT
jgi:LAS superfamily LD-carboxypeptidase LdcB